MQKYKEVEMTPYPYKTNLELQETEATYSRDRANRVAHLRNKGNPQRTMGRTDSGEIMKCDEDIPSLHDLIPFQVFEKALNESARKKIHEVNMKTKTIEPISSELIAGNRR